MPKIDINGIELEYQRYGPNTGRAESIIFAHGAGGQSTLMVSTNTLFFS